MHVLESRGRNLSTRDHETTNYRVLFGGQTNSMSSSSELDDCLLLSVSEDLVPSRPEFLPSTVSLDFDGLLSPPLVLHQDLKVGCGGQLWPAGITLTQYLLRHKQDEMRRKTMFVRLGILFYSLVSSSLCNPIAWRRGTLSGAITDELSNPTDLK